MLSVLSDQIEELIETGRMRRLYSGDACETSANPQSFVKRSDSPVCNAPWVSAVMEADGTVRPCFFHKPIGRVDSATTLFDVVNGPEAIAFRAALDVATNPVCQRCVCSLNWQSGKVNTPLLH